MARLARLVVPGHPHYVTQRGNRWQKVFFSEQDYADYLTQLTFWAGRAGTEIWSYCLMPNQVHLILVPAHPDGLRAALGGSRPTPGSSAPAPRSARRIAATPALSMSARAGAAICGSNAFAALSWTVTICRTRRAMWRWPR